MESEVAIYCTAEQQFAQQSPIIIETKRAVVTVYLALGFLPISVVSSFPSHIALCSCSPVLLLKISFSVGDRTPSVEKDTFVLLILQIVVCFVAFFLMKAMKTDFLMYQCHLSKKPSYLLKTFTRLTETLPRSELCFR